MAIPGFKEFIRPTLEVISNAGEVDRSNLVQLVKSKMGFTDDEANERLSSGQSRLNNRVGWAVTYLKKADLIRFPTKGIIVATAEGQKFLKEHKGPISPKDLEKFPGYIEFREKKNLSEQLVRHDERLDEIDPMEKIDIGAREIRLALIDELKDKLLAFTPLQFEKFVLDLVKGLGYGEFGQIQHTGGAGDFGVDGIVLLDRLGIDKIYLQAKRYNPDNKVSSSDIQKFFGALKGRQATKGIFLTTSTYQNSAKEYSKSVSDTLVLLDGNDIAGLMIDAQVGVSCKKNIVIPVIDNDYFDE